MAEIDLRTLVTLAVRHLFVRRARGLVLLFGFAVGTGVMMVLLSVGEAMVVQSRDVALVGGGEVTVLPEGIDLEGLRTGSMAGLFFGVDRSRFLQRQWIGGERLADVVATVSPVIEHKLVYLRRGGATVPLRAGAELPSAASAVGAPLNVLEGQWKDDEDDRRYADPTPEELYHEIDRFHPPMADSSWAEWHYFNVAPGPGERWYLTYLAGGPPDGAGRRGGQLLVTRHRPGRSSARFETLVPAEGVRIDTTRADLALGPHTVTQRDGRYRIVGRATGPTGAVRFDLEIHPAPNGYFPPVEIGEGTRRSGYVVPALRGTASGTICEADECRRFDEVAAYHDHNWGVWRATIWNWGQGRGQTMSVVYGGVISTDSALAGSRSPYFLAVVDSLGIRQILRFATIDYRGRGPGDASTPERFALVAARGPDTVRLSVRVLEAQATPVVFAPKRFLQMRGAFTLAGRLLGRPVADSGFGFFETFVDR
jgi:hypothetical protein